VRDNLTRLSPAVNCRRIFSTYPNHHLL